MRYEIIKECIVVTKFSFQVMHCIHLKNSRSWHTFEGEGISYILTDWSLWNDLLQYDCETKLYHIKKIRIASN